MGAGALSKADADVAGVVVEVGGVDVEGVPGEAGVDRFDAPDADVADGRVEEDVELLWGAGVGGDPAHFARESTRESEAVGVGETRLPEGRRGGAAPVEDAGAGCADQGPEAEGEAHRVGLELPDSARVEALVLAGPGGLLAQGSGKVVGIEDAFELGADPGPGSPVVECEGRDVNERALVLHGRGGHHGKQVVPDVIVGIEGEDVEEVLVCVA
ncbi:hypothetical protein ES708_25784 [subsurface metagenome]